MIDRVEATDLKPGDVVLLGSNEPISPSTAEAIKAQWGERFPRNPVVIINGGLQVSKLTFSERLLYRLIRRHARP